MNKLRLFFLAFRRGSELANAGAWKNGQITVTALGGFLVILVQLADSFGAHLPVDSEQVSAIAAGVIAAANIVLTLTTSSKVGLPANGADGGADGSERGGDGQPASVDRFDERPLA